MWPYPEHWEIEACRPHTLAALQDMSELNYLRLRRLIPDVESLPRQAVSSVCGCLDLHLKILDRWKYTTNLILTYHFRHDDTVEIEPNLNIRLYHDVKSAEAVSGILHSPGALNALAPDFALQHKWRLNRFLYKWVSYSLYHGHQFRSEPRKRCTVV